MVSFIYFVPIHLEVKIFRMFQGGAAENPISNSDPLSINSNPESQKKTESSCTTHTDMYCSVCRDSKGLDSRVLCRGFTLKKWVLGLLKAPTKHESSDI